jgi:enoyl-CoA hydratase
VTEAARIAVARDGAVGRLTINRPDAGNAVAGQDLETLAAALRDFHADATVRVIVLAGAGPKFFCTGSDISELAGGLDDIGRHLGKWHAVVDLLEESPKPVIAAINGAAVGGGLELALACQHRIAAEGAKLGLPELKVGLFPAAGGVRRLTRLIGQGRTLELVLGAELLAAPAARELGIVERVVAADALEPAVAQAAGRLAQFEPNAVAATLACALAAARCTDDNQMEVSLLRECYGNPRNREVLQSFLARPRAPRPAP